MSVVVGVSPSKLVPFQWIDPRAEILKAVKVELSINFLRFIFVAIRFI